MSEHSFEREVTATDNDERIAVLIRAAMVDLEQRVMEATGGVPAGLMIVASAADSQHCDIAMNSRVMIGMAHEFTGRVIGDLANLMDRMRN